MKLNRLTIAIYCVLAVAFVEMGFGSFRAGAGLVALALALVLLERTRRGASREGFFANRARWLDIVTLVFLLISLTILAIVVPSPQ